MGGILQVTSRDNAHVKEVRRVRDGRQRDKIFLEGLRLVEEAIRSRIQLDALFLSNEGRSRAADLIKAASPRLMFQLSNAAFESITDTVTTQGVIALGLRPTATASAIERRLAGASVPLVVFLHRTNNPSNLGAVIRTAEAAGAAGVIVSAGSADAFSPKALRAAMGSSFRLPLWNDVGLDEAFEWSAKNDLKAVATEIDATRSYLDVDWRIPRMLVLGSEAHGLSNAEMKDVDERICVPMEKGVESLNLAVASGVVLFEARRQNQKT